MDVNVLSVILLVTFILLSAIILFYLIKFIIMLICRFIKIILSIVLAFIIVIFTIQENNPEINELSDKDFTILLIKECISLTIFIYIIIEFIIYMIYTNKKKDYNGNGYFSNYVPIYNEPKLKKIKSFFKNFHFFPTKTFKPEKDLFYCFFRERNGSPDEVSYKTINGLFGIYNSSDIQRYFYFPGTKKIVTFIGFTNKEEMFYTIERCNLISAAVGKTIYIYEDHKQIDSCDVYRPSKRKRKQKYFKQNIFRYNRKTNSYYLKEDIELFDIDDEDYFYEKGTNYNQDHPDYYVDYFYY